MKKLALYFGFFLVSQCSIVLAIEAKPNQVFEQLKELVGDWRSSKAGSATTVNYKLIANGTSLIETWTMSPTRQSMTVYTLDGKKLIATHYCPQGNAPRLQLKHTDKNAKHHFEFFDGANLQDPSGHHEHAFWVQLNSPESMTRSETYIKNSDRYNPKSDLGEVETFIRSK